MFMFIIYKKNFITFILFNYFLYSYFLYQYLNYFIIKIELLIIMTLYNIFIIK